MGRIRRGVDPDLEAAADALLYPVLKAITKPSERDVLTHYMEASRHRREVYNINGIPDPAVRSGLFHRAYNPTSPHLNSRDGTLRGSRFSSSSRIAQDCWPDPGDG
ncbi:DUF7236 family protein [Kitasatospora viridis]|uniref:Uncharacterized protein n=1 Tax=Kitasatospora viridis TaxID=281105 RepID=A0A561SA78_9ACTN|nr:hypothetical protein [Kitasatospora viridis]TWF71779.1 hypothetical protein FHX73_18150 [Kitasatospora viridis]